MIPQLLESNMIVRFQDCDPYNHLNNSRYIDYFMNAREDQVLEAYGLDIYAMGRKMGIGWVVAYNQIAYLHPAFLMEKVRITTQIITFTSSWMTVEFRMFDSTDGKLKALMWTKFVHVDIRNGKSIRHSDELMDMFENAILPVEEKSFEDRLKSARQGLLALSS